MRVSLISCLRKMEGRRTMHSGLPSVCTQFLTRASSDPFIAAAVPMRPIIAVYHHIRRAYHPLRAQGKWMVGPSNIDRKSTRLNSSHTVISYAVFCLKKKKEQRNREEGGRVCGERERSVALRAIGERAADVAQDVADRLPGTGTHTDRGRARTEHREV